MNKNTFSVKDGKIYLNGEQVYCVTCFKYEVDEQGLANVTLSFDVPIEATEFSYKNQVTFERHSFLK